MHRSKIYVKSNPWLASYYALRARCNNKNCDSYKFYGKKGIKAVISTEEIKELWFRDKAYNMDRPSIDRKNNKKNYELNNCRFIELKIHNTKDKGMKIGQYDLNGNLIKIWKSQCGVAKELNIYPSYISKVINGKLKSTYGFIFKKE